MVGQNKTCTQPTPDRMLIIMLVQTYAFEGCLILNKFYTYYRAGGMCSQLVRPNLTLRTMQLNAWVADNFMNIEILFLPLIL